VCCSVARSGTGWSPDLPQQSLHRSGAPSGADAEGYAGLEDGVDYHWGEIFKAVAFSTILSAGAQAGSSGEENDIVRALRQGASDRISQTAQ
jgi:type IV secretory pathway VirB10-like protein